MCAPGQPFSIIVDGFSAHARGELDMSCTDVLVDACRHGVERLDLRDVTFIDSSGVRGLMRASGLVQRRGATLVLVSPSRQVRRVLEMLGLSDHLPIVED